MRRRCIDESTTPEAGRELSEEKVLFATEHLELTEAEKKLNSVEQTKSVQEVKKGLSEISEILKDSQKFLAERALKHLFRDEEGLLEKAVGSKSLAALSLVGRRLPIQKAFESAVEFWCDPAAVRQFLELGADPWKVNNPICKGNEIWEILKTARSQKAYLSSD